jgi:hypothetical protein
VLIDHAAKASGNQAGPIGASQKRNIASGLTVRFQAIEQFAPGSKGKAKLHVSKDRGGTVKGRHKSLCGMFIVDETQGEVRAEIQPPGTPQTKQNSRDQASQTLVAVSRYIALHPGENRTEVLRGVGGNHQRTREALDALVEQRFVVEVAQGQGKRYHSIKPYVADTTTTYTDIEDCMYPTDTMTD